MTEDCRLRAANGLDGVECDGPDCIYWRLVGHLGIAEGVDDAGCAIQHFRMLDGGQEVAAWLMSVKRRLEYQTGGPVTPDSRDVRGRTER
jgi:hypothetical protein